MTPQQQVLNSDLPHTDEFKSLSEKVDNLSSGQLEIKETLKTEMKSQEDFKTYVQEQFDRGTEKFSKMETDMKELEKKVDDGFKSMNDKLENNFNNLINEIKDDKLSKMTEQYKRLQDEKDTDKKLKKEFYMGVLKTLVGAVLVSLAMFALYKMGISVPTK